LDGSHLQAELQWVSPFKAGGKKKLSYATYAFRDFVTDFGPGVSGPRKVGGFFAVIFFGMWGSLWWDFC